MSPALDGEFQTIWKSFLVYIISESECSDDLEMIFYVTGTQKCGAQNLMEFTTILKSHLGASTQKCDAQNLMEFATILKPYLGASTQKCGA